MQGWHYGKGLIYYTDLLRCSITLRVTSGSSISTPEIRQNRTSAVYLRVVWTSAFKGYIVIRGLEPRLRKQS